MIRQTLLGGHDKTSKWLKWENKQTSNLSEQTSDQTSNQAIPTTKNQTTNSDNTETMVYGKKIWMLPFTKWTKFWYPNSSNKRTNSPLHHIHTVIWVVTSTNTRAIVVARNNRRQQSFSKPINMGPTRSPTSYPFFLFQWTTIFAAREMSFAAATRCEFEDNQQDDELRQQQIVFGGSGSRFHFRQKQWWNPATRIMISSISRSGKRQVARVRSPWRFWSVRGWWIRFNVVWWFNNR